jgi:2-polyprenyl-6-methoxyphenol hydroxylase-like FAD-dependent oxidoreductase
MKALVVGAGVCGPVTAMALKRAGIDARVYEAHNPPTNDVGSYLTVATNGLDALRAIDAHAPVLKAAFPTNRTVLLSGTGKVLGDVPLGSNGPGRDASHTIKRAHLHRALHEEAVRQGVVIEFGRRLTAVGASDSHVEARFDDGSRASGDLLIGCDGVHSVTRTIIDPRAPRPRYVGLLNFGGYTPGTAIGEQGAWHMIFGARAFFGYVPDDVGGTVWFANVPRHPATPAERQSTTVERWKSWLIGLFAGDRGPAAELIRQGCLQLVADNTHDLPSVPVWHKTSRIIIGDAAHAPSPSSGQGASMALEDAVILATCLRDVSEIQNALSTFERLRRRRVERIVAQGARSSSSKAAGPVGRVLRDLMLPFVFRHLVTDTSMAWMYDHHIEWNAGIRFDERLAYTA